MKVALAHDYLNQYGGGERVLEVLMEMFPEAPIYTILHDSKKTGEKFATRIGGASFLNFHLARKYHRLFIPLMPLAARSINLSDRYDLIISDTAGFAKGISYDPKRTKHLSYIHTPLRYAWETKDYFQNRLFTSAFAPAFNYLKRWDRWVATKPDALLANSNFIASKVRDYYGREAKVVYPPVDTEVFYKEKIKSGDYYLAAGRLLHYKRFDLVVDAFANLGLPLKIVGSGPEKERLILRAAKLKAHNISFISFVGDDELRQLYNGAKALIFPQVEDFGLVAAEAQACGVPIIAYAAGGAKEIVQEGVTGKLFYSQTVEHLSAAVREFEKQKFNRTKIAAAGERFSKDIFKREVIDAIARLG